MDMILGADTATIFWIQNHLVHPWLTPWMIGASSLGDLHGLGIIWCLLAGVLIYTRKYRRVGIAVILALLFCLVVGDLALKNLIMRARPCVTYPLVTVLADGGPTNYSFPSGHTFGAFAMASALACGVRTDVIAGAALGIFFGVAAWRLAERILRNFPPTLICRCNK